MIPPLTRASDWPARLAAFIAARERRPFRWGEHDCCLFAADWVLECTGTDPAAALRGYDSERQARRLLKDAGGLRALVDELLPAHPSVAWAGRGDVVLVDGGHGPHNPALAVIDGLHAVAPAPAAGLARVPMAYWLYAWRVG